MTDIEQSFPLLSSAEATDWPRRATHLRELRDPHARAPESPLGGRQIRLRQNTHFSSGFKQIAPVEPDRSNFLLSFYQKSWFLVAIPSRSEGRFAVVTDVEAGCGGRVGAAAWSFDRADEQHDAHGQVASS
jgi:hypothetical protein